MHTLLKRRKEEEEDEEEDQLTPLPPTWKLSNFGEDSIEMAPSEDDIFDQSDIVERMLKVEKECSTSSIDTFYFKSEYFEHPALYRVLFVGSTTEDHKKDIFKKLSQGFIHVLQQNYHRSNSNTTAKDNSNINSKSKDKDASLLRHPITPFKEIKHNLILLSDEDEPELLSDICEDVGVSMIEADFTWNSNAVRFSSDPKNLLLQYAWNQCPNPRELPAAWLEDEIFQTTFTGFMCPDTTPNGIDLCVYFYDGKDDTKTKEDLGLLCLLRKLGIYVLPLTSSRDEKQKSRFADLLTEYKVRCLDLGNLEVGQEPSFQKSRQNVTQHDRLSRLQDMECTQLKVPRVATYQILAVDQFCAIENKAIFQLLKRTRERQVIREVLKEELMSRQQQQEEEKEEKQPQSQWSANLDHLASDYDDDDLEDDDDDDNGSDDTIEPVILPKPYVNFSHRTSKRSWYFDYCQFTKAIFVSLLVITCCTLLFSRVKTRQARWTMQFDVDSDLSFTAQTRDSHGRLDWASVEPQVWINDQFLIPVQKVDDRPGNYHLHIDYNTLYSVYSHDSFIRFAFSVNTTAPHIAYTTSTATTFMILHPKSPLFTAKSKTSDKPHRYHPDNSKSTVANSHSFALSDALKSLKFFTTNKMLNIFDIIFVE